MFEPSTPVVLLFAVTVVAGLLVCIAVANRALPGSRWFALILTGVGLWSLLYALELGSTTAVWQLRWQTLKYLPIVALPPAWLAFAFAYSGNGQLLTARRVAIVEVPQAATFGLIATNGVHHLFWSARRPVSVDGLTFVQSVPGIGFWVAMAYSYALLVAGTLLLLWTAVRQRELYRWQSGLVVVAALLPLVANAAFHLELLPNVVIDPTPILFLGTCLLFAVSIYHYRFLDLSPVAWELARDVAIEDMRDSVVVLDARDRIIDLNSSAATLAGCARSAVIGKQVDEVLESFEAAVRRDAETDEVELFVDGERRYYEVHVSPIRVLGGREVGRLVTLYDVTSRRVRERQLEVQNRLLRHNLRNELNIVLGYLDLVDGRLDDSETRELLATARRTSERLVEQSEKSRQLERLLDQRRRVDDVDVVPLLEAVVDDCREAFSTATIETSIPPTLRAATDDTLCIVVRELVDNAVQHADGPVSIRVTARRRADRVEIRVADDGPGISAYERAVLERDHETALEHSSGLGLWLVKWTTARYGGVFRIEDNDPRGTVAVVELLAPTGSGSEPSDERTP